MCWDNLHLFFIEIKASQHQQPPQRDKRRPGRRAADRWRPDSAHYLQHRTFTWDQRGPASRIRPGFTLCVCTSLHAFTSEDTLLAGFCRLRLFSVTVIDARHPATASSFLPGCTVKEEIHLTWQHTSIIVHSALRFSYLKQSSIYCHLSLFWTINSFTPPPEVKSYMTRAVAALFLLLSLQQTSNRNQTEVRMTRSQTKSLWKSVSFLI